MYGCSVELGTELQSFEDDGKRVLAKLVKMKDNKKVPEIFEASYLIGADGAKGVWHLRTNFVPAFTCSTRCHSETTRVDIPR